MQEKEERKDSSPLAGKGAPPCRREYFCAAFSFPSFRKCPLSPLFRRSLLCRPEDPLPLPFPARLVAMHTAASLLLLSQHDGPILDQQAQGFSTQRQTYEGKL